MGSVAVLQPKVCLPRNRFVNSDRRRHIPKSSPNANPNMNRSEGRRKRSPARNSSIVDNNAPPVPTKEIVMEQVKILKRGEVLGDMMNMNTNTMVKGNDDKSILLGKRRNVLKKKVKFEGVVKNLDVDLKNEKVNFEGSEMKVAVDLNLNDDLVLSTTDWLGPGPEKLPKLSDFSRCDTGVNKVFPIGYRNQFNNLIVRPLTCSGIKSV